MYLFQSCCHFIFPGWLFVWVSHKINKQYREDEIIFVEHVSVKFTRKLWISEFNFSCLNSLDHFQYFY